MKRKVLTGILIIAECFFRLFIVVFLISILGKGIEISERTAKILAFIPFVGFTEPQNEHFIKSIEYANSATKIINRDGESPLISQGEMEEIIEFEGRALKEALLVDINRMNSHLAGLGDHYRDEFIKGLRLIIEGYEKHDMIKLFRGQVLLDEWGEWYAANFDKIKRGQ